MKTELPDSVPVYYYVDEEDGTLVVNVEDVINDIEEIAEKALRGEYFVENDSEKEENK